MILAAAPRCSQACCPIGSKLRPENLRKVAGWVPVLVSQWRQLLYERRPMLASISSMPGYEVLAQPSCWTSRLRTRIVHNP